MSANRYSTCPRCSETYQNNVANAIVELGELYSTVDMATYESKREQFERIKTAGVPASLHENWEFSLKGFTLHAAYDCYCDRCGFSYGFTKEVDTRGGV